jgi:hypothetical protein
MALVNEHINTRGLEDKHDHMLSADYETMFVNCDQHLRRRSLGSSLLQDV